MTEIAFTIYFAFNEIPIYELSQISMECACFWNYSYNKELKKSNVDIEYLNTCKENFLFAQKQMATLRLPEWLVYYATQFGVRRNLEKCSIDEMWEGNRCPFGIRYEGEEIIYYKDFQIEPFSCKDTDGYTVFYNGDDIYYPTVWEAMRGIDSLIKSVPRDIENDKTDVGL